MPKPKLKRPTDAEIGILRVLWQHGPSTVKQVHEALRRGTGYTTVLKLMQIMTEKGLLLRDESRRTHVYRPKQREEETQRHLLRDLMERAFEGSTSKLVLQALSAKQASSEELAQLKQILKEIEEKKP